uniref:C-CAP/cofactor C-like domain-containing protein n=1 Tax=Lutzomyia longipalpis TaxID=7200 RepID=A0A1B0CQZ5_LUTLO
MDGKDRITEFFNRRHKERQTNLANLQELRSKEAAEYEGLEYFEQLTGTFNKILGSIQELQKYLSTSTIFLTEHKIKTCQGTINDLQAQAEEKRTRLIPKKKFGFKSYTKPEVLIEKSENGAKKPLDELDGLKRRQVFQWTVDGRRNEEILLDGSATNGQDITLNDLENCLVRIVGHPGSIQLSKLKNCVVLAGPVARSVFADDCHKCKFVFACQQMRLHTSHTCDIYLHVTCRGIIEDCTEIRTAAYNFSYPNIHADFQSAGLDVERNNWQDLADFNWLSPDRPSPNWKKMDQQGLIEHWDAFLEQFRKENSIHSHV